MRRREVICGGRLKGIRERRFCVWELVDEVGWGAGHGDEGERCWVGGTGFCDMAVRGGMGLRRSSGDVLLACA